MTVLDLPAVASDEEQRKRLVYAPVVPLWTLQVSVLVVVAAKLAFSIVVPPGYDDAYYWLWGQHVQWSYLDHAPLVGWGAWLSFHLLGWNPLAVHFTPLACFALMALVMRAWAKRIAPDQWRHYFWATLAIYGASPLMMSISSILYPDPPMMAASLAALHFLALFLADWRAGNRRYTKLYVGAGLIGLAVLGKYNGAVIGFGLVAAILIDPKLRPLLRTRQLYAAGLLAALFLVPIVAWNATNDFASLRLHSEDRFAHRASSLSFEGSWRFLWQTALYFSPLLVWPIFKFLRTPADSGPQGQMVALGRPILIGLTAVWAGLAAWGPASGQVAPHWDIVALLPFILVAPLFLTSRWQMSLHLLLGTVFAVLVTAYYVAAPLVTDALHVDDGEAIRNYGQEELAAAAGRMKWMYNADFVGARPYYVAAKLAYGAGSDVGIMSLSDDIDQFYFWHDVGALAGKTAIIVSDVTLDASYFDGKFSSVSHLGSVTPTRFGHSLITYQLYLGRGFHGERPVQ